MPVLAMSVVLWGARRYDIQAGSPEDRAVERARPVLEVMEMLLRKRRGLPPKRSQVRLLRLAVPRRTRKSR